MLKERAGDPLIAAPAAPDADSGLVPQLGMMFEALWTSPVRNTLFAMAAALFVVIAVTAYGQIRLNDWNQPFYDALSRRDFGGFMTQLGVFGIIAGSLLVLNVLQRWLGEMAKVKMREGLVQDLVRNWLTPGTALRIAQSGTLGVNPDQRMHEDARHLTELSADLGIGLLQASILLATFINVLWDISSRFSFHIAGRDFAIPGYMVWTAILYSATASLLSYWVGASLVDRNEAHYAREADLRYSLVRVNEHVDAIALAGGEADEARHLGIDLGAVLAAMRRLVMGLTNLTWVTAGSGWFMLVAPIIAAAPLYFAGKISFGGLMLASGAFLQVQSSLRWFVDNFSSIADWRATLLRVASLRRAMISPPAAAPGGIRIDDGDPGELLIDGLALHARSGVIRLAESPVRIAAGERVLIRGDTGIARTLVFRTLAGLWSSGTGRIIRPRDAEILYMPRSPYLPPGTLRDVLAYPAATERYPAAAYGDALRRLGLDRLVPQLDESRRWDRVLPEDDQQRVALARILLHAPRWLIIDEVFDTLDEGALALVSAAFDTVLGHAAIIYIGRGGTAAALFPRVLRLVDAPAGTPLP